MQLLYSYSLSTFSSTFPPLPLPNSSHTPPFASSAAFIRNLRQVVSSGIFRPLAGAVPGSRGGSGVSPLSTLRPPPPVTADMVRGAHRSGPSQSAEYRGRRRPGWGRAAHLLPPPPQATNAKYSDRKTPESTECGTSQAGAKLLALCLRL
ncbi:hypothetical protein NDU88_001521 [Pleurodeles waltl]|uniref:Uncharacterized protein n=1 Tax=Pleurodeles waltl TaxID=8319 RepID=A0AAV7WLR7_PLEWA|nr:hypothetical protein NDU88_001521 [Pleurodeles waltl]